MNIRKYLSSDLSELIAMFYNTVHTVNAADYTEEQLDAWTSNLNAEKWGSSLAEHYSLVAVDSGKIVGFGDIDLERAYLDRLYTHSDYQGMGIASAICCRLEEQCPHRTIVTHASITARRFFENRGYHTVAKQSVERSGVFLTNYIMEKPPEDICQINPSS